MQRVLERKMFVFAMIVIYVLLVKINLKYYIYDQKIHKRKLKVFTS